MVMVPNTQKRDLTIDNIRGFAIVCVVVGHCIMRFYETNLSFVNNYWFRLIYSFHMPLFMFVGGWVAWLTFDGKLTKLKRRALALMIPFVVWNIVNFAYTMIVNGELSEGYWYYTLMGQGYLWFFYSICLCYVLLYLIMQLPLRLELLSASLICGIMVIIPQFFQLGLINWYFFFFICGYFANKYRNLNPIKNSWLLSLFLIVLGVSMSYFWHTDGTVDLPYMSNKYLKLFWRYTMPLIWIAGVFSLFYNIGSRWSADKIGQTLGRYTMEIYIQNYAWICLVVLAWNYKPLYWLETIAITAFTLSISITMAKFVERNKRLAFWLLGKQ